MKTQTSTSVSSRLADHEAQWRRMGIRRATAQAELPTISSGCAALDRQLPGGGYPRGAVTELLCADLGLGELQLLLGPLATAMAGSRRSQLALIAPPMPLNAPALAQAGIDCARAPIIACRDDAERVWCVEQLAALEGIAAFVIWGDSLEPTALRRLQLAAERADCPLFVFRSLRRAAERSPAALRLAVTAGAAGQRLEILKCRGPAGARVDTLRPGLDRAWQLDGPADGPWPAPERENRPDGVLDRVAAADPASNDLPTDEVTHVARPAFSPLGAR